MYGKERIVDSGWRIDDALEAGAGVLEAGGGGVLGAKGAGAALKTVVQAVAGGAVNAGLFEVVEVELQAFFFFEL